MKTTSFYRNAFLKVTIAIAYASAGGIAFCASTPSTDLWSSQAVLSDSGPHHRTWTLANTNVSQAGEQQRRIIEIGTGMQYRDGQQWAPSEPVFSVNPEGDAFVAEKLHYKVRLQADNLNAAGSIQVTTPDGLVLRSTPVAIGLYDASSGHSLILAGITNSPGVLVSSNKVLYENAFDENGIKASVICTVERGAFAADIVLTSKLDPAKYGFPANTTRIQMFTEYYDAPQPQKIRKAIRVEKDKARRQRMASPDLIDETLAFGELVVGRGSVYAMSTRTNRTRAVVAKEFKTMDHRTFLIESVEYPSVRKGLLAMAEGPARTGSLRRPDNLNYAAIPKAADGAASLSPVRKRARVEMASITPRDISGIVIDPIQNISGNFNSFKIFQADTTYLVVAPVYCNGTAEIEGGAVFKYWNCTGSGAVTTFIEFNNQVTMRTGPYRPAIFTAKDDNSVGETVPGSTGDPTTRLYASPAMQAINYLTISYCRFSYANVAFECDLYDFAWVTIEHSQFVNCVLGVSLIDFTGGCGSYGSGLFVNLNNCLLANTSSLIDGYFDGGGSTTLPVTLTHCTIAGMTQLVGQGTGCTIAASVSSINSIFANVGSWGSDGCFAIGGDYNGFYPANGPQFGTHATTSLPNPFETVRGGSYYLAAVCSFRGAGTAAIPSSILAAIRQKTTFSPVVYANATLLGTTFGPRPIEDSGTNPDLGYHYAVLDYAFGGCTAQGNLTFSAGTVVGWFRTSSGSLGYGIHLGDSVSANFNGTQTALNYWVRLNTVQELDLSGGTGPGGITGGSPTTATPTINARFTSCSVLDGDGPHFGNEDSLAVTVRANHCEFLGGSLGSSVIALDLTNCLCYRSTVTRSTTVNWGDVTLRNCTMFGGQLTLVYTGTGGAYQRSVRDCAFDQTSFTLNPTSVDFDYNALSGGDPSSPVGVNNLTSITFPWYPGPLGNFYLAGNSTLLKDKGSRLATAAGLADFTMLTSEVKEDGGQVDIGYHYVALDGNGNAIDSNNDGIPDWWTDSYGPSASDPLAGAGGDPDGDGLSNLQEYQHGGNPIEHDDLANPLGLPVAGSRYLRVISPSLLELVQISLRRFDLVLITNINKHADDLPGIPYTVFIARYKPSNQDGQPAGSLYVLVNDPVNPNNNLSMNEAQLNAANSAALTALKNSLPTYWTYPLSSSQKTTIIQKVAAFSLTLPVDFTWDFADDPIPNPSSFQVTTNGVSISVLQVAYKRHALYSSYSDPSDTRIENSLYLVLAGTIPDNALVAVNNSASLWPSYMQFIAHKDPLRYGPAIHVNQEGYLLQVNQGGSLVPASQKAVVGLYCGVVAPPATVIGATKLVSGTYTTIGGTGNTYGPVNLMCGDLNRFTGTAYGELVHPTSLSSSKLSNVGGWVGFKFTVGPSAMTVTHLARWVVTGNSRIHTVKLVTLGGVDVSGGSVSVNTTAFGAEQFGWVQLGSPVTLTANATYYLLSQETSGLDQWYNYDSQMKSAGLGQIDFTAIGSSSLKLVDAASGVAVSGFSPTIAAATDAGGVDSSQYQGLRLVDLNGFGQAGEYRLQVDGLGASFPFRIEDAVSMKMARTYALGLYHQRCGSGSGRQVNDLPFTRFTHGNCHTAQVHVIVPQSPDYATAWNIISDPNNGYGGTINPDQKASPLNSQANMLFPFSERRASGNNGYEVVTNGIGGAIDVSGGHHDAGDYSKYTINSAHFIHSLVFAADNFPHVADLGNLGLPESVQGKSDLLQEAKWEADFLLKIQDKGTVLNVLNQPVVDGGFYTLVYPETRQYETDVLPDHGDHQIVWPKTTSVTAAAVGALAEIGSSRTFCSQFGYDYTDWVNNPYLAAAKRGWDFLMRAIDRYGKDNCYQKCYFYGDTFTHNDELAWAAAAMFAAGYSDTQNGGIHDPHTLLVHNNDGTGWYPHPETANSSIPFSYTCVGADNPPCNSWWYGWWGMFMGYGCAVRDYAFAVSSGRRSAGDMNSTYLSHCQTAVTDWGHIVRSWSENNAYRTSLTTSGLAGYGWAPEFHFPGYWAFDIAVADLIDTTSDDHSRNSVAVLGSLNFEAGCNPNNVGFLEGLGWRRQRVVVNQYWINAGRIFPPTGNPIGGVNDFQSSGLNSFFYPLSQSGNPAGFALYDRWADAATSTSEFVGMQTARSLATAAWLAAQSTANRNQQWAASDVITAQGSITPTLSLLTLNSLQSLQLSSTLSLAQARTVWEVPGQQAPIGQVLTYTPTSVGENRLVEAEAALPDGRRVFASQAFSVYDPINGGTEFQIPVPDDHKTIALYHFNSLINGGTAFPDDSGNGHPLALNTQGHVTLSDNTMWMQNPAGKSARFHDVGDYAEITDLPDLIGNGGPQTLSIEARVYPRGFKGSGLIYLIWLHQDYDTEWAVFYNPPPYVAQIDGPQAKTLLSAGDWATYVTPNTWHSIKITLDSSGVSRLYVDNTLRGSSTTAPNYGRTGNWTLHIGDFDGDIDELRISNVVR